MEATTIERITGKFLLFLVNVFNEDKQREWESGELSGEHLSMDDRNPISQRGIEIADTVAQHT